MIRHWLKAIRLRTLPLALTGTLMGAFLVMNKGHFNGIIFLLSTLTTICLQILSNLANDYGDTLNGADNKYREGPKRMVQSGNISLTAMKNAIYISVICSLIFGIATLWVAFRHIETQTIILFLLGLLSVAAAIKYTVGKNPYGYIGLGDVFVFFFFGIVAVLGNIFLYTQEIQLVSLLPAASVGLMSVGVLNVNNIRDIESDKKAGKQSIPVRLGRKAAVLYHTIILISIPTFLLAYVFTSGITTWCLVFLISVPLYWKNLQAVKNKRVAMELDPYLKQLAISSVLMVVFFGVGLFLKKIL